MRLGIVCCVFKNKSPCVEVLFVVCSKTNCHVLRYCLLCVQIKKFYVLRYCLLCVKIKKLCVEVLFVVCSDKRLLCVEVLFVVCWLPLNLINLAEDLDSNIHC